MKIFFALALLVCSTTARPDVSNLGYNYAETGAEGAVAESGFTDAESSLSSTFEGGSDNGDADSFGSGSLGAFGSNGFSSNGNGFGYNGGSGQAPIVRKQFYLHSAPEDRDEGRAKHFTLGRPQKNYRVVFVKAPSSTGARLSVDYAPKEEKTVIYVLSQKEHILDPNDIATPAPTQPSKPEVFFVKYKTPQEAEHAQKQIQAQYDALGGSSQFSDEGIAPVRSVIGSFGTGSLGGGSGNFASASNVNSGYLPPRRH